MECPECGNTRAWNAVPSEAERWECGACGCVVSEAAQRAIREARRRALARVLKG